MTQQDFSDVQIDRARIDGGFSFALAAFLLGLGLLAILDRVGMPDEVLRVGVLGLIFSGLVVIAVSLRTMRPLDFYAGSRRLPASYAGIVFAGAAFGLFLPFLPPLQNGISFSSVAIGFCLGFLGLLFGAGPLLRRSGAYSFADFIIARFPSLSVRFPLVLLIAFCGGCVAVGGFEIAIRGLIATAGAERLFAAIFLGSVLTLFIVPSGLAAVIWISAAAAIVMVAALALPLFYGTLLGFPLALPIFGDQLAWTRALGELASVTGADPQAGFELPIVIAFGIGVALLPPLFGAAVATRDESTAWRTGLAGTLWLLIGALLIAATLAGAILALKTDVSGRLPPHLPSTLLDVSGRGQVAICGLTSDNPDILNRVCALRKGTGQPLQLSDISAHGIDLLTVLPGLRGSEPTLSRLAAAFMIVLGVALAAAGTQNLVTSLCQDLLHPARRLLGPVSRRLAVARGVAMLFIVAMSVALATRQADPRFFFTLAVMLTTALVAPLLVLAFVPRATTKAAFAALCVGAFVMTHFFVYSAPDLPLGKLATDAAFAATDGVAVALFICFMPKKKSAPPPPLAT